MRYKSNVCLDILAVLAYGPQPVINSAGQVLLHYYPLKDVGMFGHYETPFTNNIMHVDSKKSTTSRLQGQNFFNTK